MVHLKLINMLQEMVDYYNFCINLLNVQSNTFKDYLMIYLYMMNYPKWKFECREISETDRNKDCPVSMELIDIDETYCQCNQCEYNIKENVIKIMFDKTNNVKCPMCRLQWQNNIVYFNCNNSNNTFIIEEKQNVFIEDKHYNHPSNAYSFALDPNEWAPAGTYPGSRIDNL